VGVVLLIGKLIDDREVAPEQFVVKKIDDVGGIRISANGSLLMPESWRC
jgi:hypothetical protein